MVITLLNLCEFKWNVDDHVYLIQLSRKISMHTGSPPWTKLGPVFFFGLCLGPTFFKLSKFSTFPIIEGEVGHSLDFQTNKQMRYKTYTCIYIYNILCTQTDPKQYTQCMVYLPTLIAVFYGQLAGDFAIHWVFGF